jgi:hypothetical protein
LARLAAWREASRRIGVRCLLLHLPRWTTARELAAEG